MRARKRRGLGWNRWSRVWFYELWDYLMITEFGITRPESAASLIGLITLQMKLTE
jgi:hypothetical protein